MPGGFKISAPQLSRNKHPLRWSGHRGVFISRPTHSEGALSDIKFVMAENCLVSLFGFEQFFYKRVPNEC